MKMNFEKLREAFLQKIPIYNNHFHFSHKFYVLAETKSVVQAIFHVFQRTIPAINFKELFWTIEFNLTKLKEVFIPNRPIIKNLLLFYTLITGWENLNYLHKSFF